MMQYNATIFGAELILELEKGYDVQRISRWADKVYSDHSGEIDIELERTIENIASMSFGEQFLYSESELLDLALDLIVKNDKGGGTSHGL